MNVAMLSQESIDALGLMCGKVIGDDMNLFAAPLMRNALLPCIPKLGAGAVLFAAWRTEKF